ncbi:Hypothetical protein A7982_06020 [Minicystis rosea]|nr:Hypothetical protein A7982_06020 [Minicystis rosea]
MSSIFAALACDALPEGLRTVRISGTEAMNALSRWEVSILVDDPTIDPDAVIGQPATLSLVDDMEGSARNVGLVVTGVAFEGIGRDGAHYTVTLGSLLWFLTLRSGYRVFLDKTTKEIIDALLKDAGIPASQIVWRLSGEYQPRPQTVLYDETDYNFFTRLLADDGISFWFDDLEGQGPVIVLADDAASHDGIEGKVELPFEGASGNAHERAIYDLVLTRVLAPSAVRVRDYDMRAPDVPIEGTAGAGGLEHYEYPSSVNDSDAAKRRAAVRLEQLRRHEQHAHAVANCVRLKPGRVMKIAGCADDWMNRAYLITGAEFTLANGARADAATSALECRVMLVPAGDMAHRPDIPRRPPRVAGVEPAITTGPGGEEIHVDDLGRVKLRFPWDRSGITDDKSSYWSRCVQINMGASMLLPRVGWEVPVAYVDGNPDRPFVLGRAYNGTAVVPYGLPGSAATTSLQSATSPRDGTTNEIRVGDTGGGQEMFVHATRDQTVTVGGSATTNVSVDETHDVKLAYQMSVGGSQSHTVGANQTVNIGTSYVTKVKGSRSEMIGGMESIKVTANRVLSIKGAYSELVGAVYGLQCNQANYTIKGAYTQLIGGSMSLKAGLGMSQGVAAARTEMVGGSRTIKASSGMNESITGAKSLTSGPDKETTDGDWTVEVGAAGNLTVGAGAKLTAGEALVLEAPEITVTVAGKINAKALQIGGGKLKAKSGTTSVKGSVKRTGGSTVE